MVDRYAMPYQSIVAENSGFTLSLRETIQSVERFDFTAHRESVSGWAGFSLGVLIASCTANLNVGLRVVYLEYILVVSTTVHPQG